MTALVEFVCVVQPPENRLIRVSVENTTADDLRLALVAIGCDYEGMNAGYAAVGIPPGGLAR